MRGSDAEGARGDQWVQVAPKGATPRHRGRTVGGRAAGDRRPRRITTMAPDWTPFTASRELLECAGDVQVHVDEVVGQRERPVELVAERADHLERQQVRRKGTLAVWARIGTDQSGHVAANRVAEADLVGDHVVEAKVVRLAQPDAGCS